MWGGRHSVAVPEANWDGNCHGSRSQLMYYLILAFLLGRALYAASSSAALLAAEAAPWLWWSALLPLAVWYWVAGFLATWTSLRSMDRHLATLIGMAFSGITTVLAVAVTVWAAHRIALSMPGPVAMVVLIAASLAGLVGLGLATEVAWLDDASRTELIILIADHTPSTLGKIRTVRPLGEGANLGPAISGHDDGPSAGSVECHVRKSIFSPGVPQISWVR
jgi:hypothetical protein